MRVRVLLLGVALLAAACGGDEAASACEAEGGFGTSSETAPEPPDAFGEGCVVLGSEDEESFLRVQLAEDEDQREIGLMGRESLPDDAGMLFVFEEEIQGAFWMKDTLIPLSIAYIDADGVIVDMHDMQPCEADPCDVYPSDAPYVQALEVNLGAFEDMGIAEGDTVRLTEE
jgi:uncharacterized membrane protein (UPF0127 family)